MYSMEQGMAQDAMQSHEDYIEPEDATLLIESGKPTKEGLKMITGKIYSLLNG